MRFSGSVALATLLGVIEIQGVASQEADYRLSGVMFAGERASLAVIEGVAGTSVAVRIGDEIEGGYVAEIGERHVRLSFPASDLILHLRAGTTTEASSFEANLRNGLEADPAAPNMRRVRDSRLFFAALSKVDSRESVADAAEEANPGQVLGRRLGELLDLPAEAAVRGIDGQAFKSSAEGLGIIRALLEQRSEVRLELEHGGQMLPPLYIFPTPR